MEEKTFIFSFLVKYFSVSLLTSEAKYTESVTKTVPTYMEKIYNAKKLHNTERKGRKKRA